MGIQTIRFGIRDTALSRLLREKTCTFRCEEVLFNRLKEAMPQVHWAKHVLVAEENPFPIGSLIVRVYMHSTDTHRGEEYNFDLNMFFKEFQ